MQIKTLIVILLAGLAVPLAGDYPEQSQSDAVWLHLEGLDFCQENHRFRLENDPSGQPWAVWESSSGIIRAGKIYGNEIKNDICISCGYSGIGASPDLTFSSGSRPWVTWIHQSEKKWRLFAQNSESSQTWEILVSSRPLFTPRIAADKNGRIWVFWTGNQNGFDQIFAAYYEYGAWSRPESLTPENAVPHFHPAVTLNAEGYPLVVWSAFNGNEYGLYSAVWTGQDWTQLPPLPHTCGVSDGEPEAFLFHYSVPVVVWTRSSRNGSQIFSTYRTGEGWAPPVNLTPGKQSAKNPAAILDKNKAVVLWRDEQGLSLKSFSFSQLLNAPPAEDLTPPGKKSFFLMDNKFAAFGDSITYGSSDGPGMGTGGYPPRLQTLLEQIFFHPFVVNKGIPGESTWEGLGRIQNVLTREMGLYLLLMEGTNDVTVPSYSLDTTIFNLEQMVHQAENYGVFPLISTIIPRARTRWIPPARSRTLELNDKIMDLAENLNLMLVNNYSAFIQYPVEMGGHEALISADDLHPNDTGYQVMAETWFDRIRLIPFPPVSITALRMHRTEEVRLTWTSNPKNHTDAGIVHYRILRRRQDSSQDFRPIGVALASQNEYSDTSINPEYQYSYALRAKNSEGVEGPVSFPVNPERGDPYPPVDIESETIINRAFLYREVLNRLTWKPNPQNQSLFSIIKYRIYRKQEGEDDDRFSLIGEVEGGKTVYLDRHLSGEDPARDYVYGISAVDQNSTEGIIGKNQTSST